MKLFSSDDDTTSTTTKASEITTPENIAQIQDAYQKEESDRRTEAKKTSEYKELAENISKSKLSDEDIKKLEEQIVPLENVKFDATSHKKLKNVYFETVQKKSSKQFNDELRESYFNKVVKKPKGLRLAVVDEHDNVVLELKNLDNIVKIAMLAKGI